MLFERYPQLKTAYGLSMKLTGIYNESITVPVARLKLARWYNELELFEPVRLKTVIDTFPTHCDTIISYFNDRLTNASAESFNAKIKDLRRQFRGINDTAFFLFRLSALYG
ncbi:MAG: transposase [Bacteroides sp.]|nr:transposase [Roseburia sp.]MCM1347307.1 transposase [Bacteroides sp.]